MWLRLSVDFEDPLDDEKHKEYVLDDERILTWKHLIAKTSE